MRNPARTEESCGMCSISLISRGRYIYLRDNENADYWSASWQPVGKDLKEYKCECRHGTAYTKMKAQYSGITSEVRYYVPLGRSYEVWNLECEDRL